MRMLENNIEIKPYSVKGVSGLYKILNTVNGKYYFGRASDFCTRYTVHVSELRRGVNHHKSSVLRRAWLKYGEDNFVFEIFLRVVDKSSLVELETEYLNKLKPYNQNVGYNMDRSSIGFTSESAKEAIRLQIENGRTWKNENNGNAKLDWGKAEEIRVLFSNQVFTIKELAHKYNVNRMTISDVLAGKRWGFSIDLRPKRLYGENQLAIGKQAFESDVSLKELSELYGVSIPSIRRAINAYKITLCQ